MVDRAIEVLASLRAVVSGAKAVPMSASCMVNRAEALSLIDRATSALAEDVSEAQRVTATSLETLERAQAEAAQIIAQAEERASYLASKTPVMEEARRKAHLLEQKSVVGVSDIEGVQCYGAIKDFDAQLRPLTYFQKMWRNEDPSVEYILTQSAPLMVPKKPDASFKIITSD